MTEIRCPLFEAALISKHEKAIISDDRQLLFYELDELASHAAGSLLALGCKPGERIALFLEADWKYVVLLMAIMRMGAVACPMNTRLPPRAVASLLASIRCEKVIAISSAKPDASLRALQIIDPNSLLTMSETKVRFDWSQHMSLERPATILFTSGSLGQPKAVLHTYGNHYYSGRGSNSNIRVRSHDKWLLSLPLYHVGGLGIMFRTIMAGAAVAIPNPGEPVETAIERLGVTHVSLVATQFQRWLKGVPTTDSMVSLKAVLLGGSAISPTLINEAISRQAPIYTSYGLTEMASQVCTSLPVSPPNKRMTSGIPLKYRQIKIADDGEILVKGQTLFAGYVEGDIVVPAVNKEGWFATGDLGWLDPEGYLTVTGRKDNLFISGGENIQPEEIEKHLVGIEGVLDAAVVPVTSEEFGARPVAFIKMRGESLDRESIAGELKKVLPGFKIPIAFFPWPESPKNGATKIDRSLFKSLAAEQIV